MNVVGLDKDNIDKKEALNLKRKILKEKKCQVIVWQTNRGFHLELLFNKSISKSEDYRIRREYGDCSERLRRSKVRDAPGVPTDILFTYKIKNGIIHWRKRIWDK